MAAVKNALKWTAGIAGGVVVVLAIAIYAVIAAALPRRAGDVDLPGLSAAVEIELDARAIPRIRAASREDAFRALGFLHAQERFFQMDLLRRSAAGELAELFGRRALIADRNQRRFAFRTRAKALLERWPARHRAWLESYSQGVNAGLDDLGARPPEYWLLGRQPDPWTAEDSVLVLFAFYTMVSNNEAYERGQGVMHAVLPSELYAFLTPSTTRFDRPLVVAHENDPTGGYVPLPVPPPDVVDLRPIDAPSTDETRIDPPQTGAASNQWAVEASRSMHGGAIVANDPHLGLRLPSVFYRCELEWSDGSARGVSIPGLPGIVIGATAALAWGATVSNADQSDWVVIEVDPDDPSRYRTPEGSEPFRVSTHEIAIDGELVADRVEVRATRWGPVVDRDWLGRPLALHAAWLEPDGADLGILDLMTAPSVEHGVRVLERWAGPSLNWVLADSAGRVAWTVNGPLPRRVGFDGSRPMSWADGKVGWQGELERPVVRAPDDGVVFTANNRTLPQDRAQTLSRMWMRPFRAKRIDELLSSEPRFDERAFLAMQLDTRVEAYDDIRALLLEVVPATESQPLLRSAREHAASWNGRADVSETGFRVVHLYYRALLERVLAPLLAPAFEADPNFVYRWPLADETMRRVLDERPAHLLTREFSDWNGFLRQVLRDALYEIENDPRRPGIEAPWGDANRVDVGHPFATLPVIGPRLRLPDDPLPGSPVSLRVAMPSYGALFRMSVSPSRPSDGILQMSGGQSGHFLSPNFSDLQADWIDGTPTPFLAGPAEDRFLLQPPP